MASSNAGLNKILQILDFSKNMMRISEEKDICQIFDFCDKMKKRLGLVWTLQDIGEKFVVKNFVRKNDW